MANTNNPHGPHYKTILNHKVTRKNGWYQNGDDTLVGPLVSIVSFTITRGYSLKTNLFENKYSENARKIDM
jgi:hypothetical protein